VSAGGEVGSRAEECLRTARALAPCARHDGGLTLSGSAAAALAELFRVLARDGVDVTDAAVRAARRLRAEAEGQDAADERVGAPETVMAPVPRTPADPGTLLASR